MVIVFVIDNYGILTNGTTMTAFRFVEALNMRGHQVRVVSVGVHGPDMYSVPERYIPIVTPVARKQSMIFAKYDKKVMQEALTGADVVHFFMPWQVARKGLGLAKKMGIPATAAFHVQPENITYGAGLGPWGAPIAFFIYFWFRFSFYRRVEHIHCPSPFIARELVKHHYTGRLHVISNGVSYAFSPVSQSLDLPGAIYPAPNFQGPEVHPSTDSGGNRLFHILMVGRFAPEKRQDVLIKAIKLSKYEDRIQLHLAGAGPREGYLRWLAKSLTNPVTFGFYQQEELINLIHSCDLYVHAADVEIEAIACLEAIACGKVPVISNSKKSATGQFALDERSLFKAGSSRDLAHKIEYWIEHPEERYRMGPAYTERAKVYRLDYSIRKAEQMFDAARQDEQTRRLEKQNPGREYKRRINKGIPTRLFSIVFYYIVAIPLLWLYCTFVLRVRIKNRKVLRKVRRKSGAVLVANHVHTLDSAMVGLAAFPKKPVFTSLPSNFKLPVAGFLVNALGSVPIPETLTEGRIFFYELSRLLRHRRFIHVFPEGELVKFDEQLRPFKRGAFQLAVEASVPVVPIRISFKKRSWGLLRFLFGQTIYVRIGNPQYPDPHLLQRESTTDLMERTRQEMERLAGNGK
ncbi:glycosyltransferase [Gracilinema caldarium]|uniref:Glycosyl transferase group 1 n=1 Tax=Gracilinema caldarium (strain ATCC 51460 / DSM 7334 / H1) TaxID=744872 RepID=F8F352_GRAC1|nr:glycosyltransferase [Gracilinema caldarium]AEJ20378.1 glycosyl transferase group 1 [Gracilinema caldarium DSM 7334]